MFKEFFAKLTGLNNQEVGPRGSKTNETMRKDREETLNAREREQMNKERMRTEGFIPRPDFDRSSEQPERHDQAA